ncbi:hypothetical protein J5X84_36315 [Streptosporangiaceae bacterium NEAU-GS5]|nr:hypothetical protein [Streptosporangiaceae bacterium NEAU-GS5]
MSTHHSDPDIEQAWTDARAALANMLRPWVIDHKVDEIAKAYVDGLELRGWRPPLGQPHDVIAAARARRQQETP